MSRRIMIVDDSKLVRVQLEDVLKGTDYEVVAYCRSGEDAIERYDEVQPDMVSSLAYKDTFERAKAIGSRGFVDKPFHQEQLLKVFEEALL